MFGRKKHGAQEPGTGPIDRRARDLFMGQCEQAVAPMLSHGEFLVDSEIGDDGRLGLVATNRALYIVDSSGGRKPGRLPYEAISKVAGGDGDFMFPRHLIVHLLEGGNFTAELQPGSGSIVKTVKERLASRIVSERRVEYSEAGGATFTYRTVREGAEPEWVFSLDRSLDLDDAAVKGWATEAFEAVKAERAALGVDDIPPGTSASKGTADPECAHENADWEKVGKQERLVLVCEECGEHLDPADYDDAKD